MTCINHLHNEASVLPLSSSLAIRYQQYALRTDHPAHASVTKFPGPRNLKQTLQSAFLTDGRLSPL